jgi:hypothetical protein
MTIVRGDNDDDERLCFGSYENQYSCRGPNEADREGGEQKGDDNNE